MGTPDDPSRHDEEPVTGGIPVPSLRAIVDGVGSGVNAMRSLLGRVAPAAPSTGPDDPVTTTQPQQVPAGPPTSGDGEIDLAAFTRSVADAARHVTGCDTATVIAVDGARWTSADANQSGTTDELVGLDRALLHGDAHLEVTADQRVRGILDPYVRTVVWVPIGFAPANRVTRSWAPLQRMPIAANPLDDVGVLVLGWHDARATERLDLERAHAFAAGLHPSYTSARLYQRARDAERDALLLVDAIADLSARLTVDEVAEAACRHARRISRALSTSVLLVGTGTGGAPGPLRCEVRSTCPGGDSFEARDVDVTDAMRRVLGGAEVVVDTTGARRRILLPVRSDATTVAGLLQIELHRDAPELPERALRLCGAISRQAGVALDRARRADELHHLAATDQLTDLPNRRQIMQELEREIARVQRSGDPLSVALVDLDHFKRYNDSHGHLEGDRLLAQYGTFLTGQLRRMDLGGRYGGEEFLILLPGTGTADAFVSLDRLRLAWRRASGETFSAGVATWRAGETWTDLLLRADAALYEAKHGGRDRVGTAGDDLVYRPDTADEHAD